MIILLNDFFHDYLSMKHLKSDRW